MCPDKLLAHLIRALNDTRNPLTLHTGTNYALGNNQGDPAAEELAQRRAQIGVGVATQGTPREIHDGTTLNR